MSEKEIVNVICKCMSALGIGFLIASAFLRFIWFTMK